MNSIYRKLLRSAVVCSSVFVLSASIASAAPQNKDQSGDKNKQAVPSDAEQKAMDKIQAAPDAGAKLEMASEFLKKYPKSSMRPKVASYVASEINKVGDSAQRITLFERLLTVFKEPGDADVINPILIDAYVKANRFDDAFALGEKSLSKHPDDVSTMWLLTNVGVDQARQNNPKFVAASKQHGEKAIQIIESGKKPADLDEAAWGQYQTKWLPQLYQWTGMLAMMTGNRDESKMRLEKAASLDSSNPIHFYLLGSVINDEYQKIAEEYQKLSPGPLRDAKRQQAEKKIDEVVELWAHSIALSEGDPQYKQLHDTALQDTQSYYSYRHGGSTTGLQQLIDKYKKKPSN